MALDKLSKKNHLAHGPFIPVFQWWYNEIVDRLNSLSSSDTVITTDTISEKTAAAGVTIDGVLIKDSAIANAAMGTAATPVARTNNPIIGASLPNVNIDKLDAAIGADADITPLARTAGPIVVNTTLHAKIDALDTAIGFDNQMSAAPKACTKTLNVFQNLDLLDTKKTVQTVKKTIGGVGVAACDFNFATAADQVEQVIDLGNIVPALARILDVFIVTNTVFTGAVSLSTEAGTTSSGHELLGAADMIAADTINCMATDHDHTVAPVIAASKVYVAATPGANWSLVTAGKMSVYVTFIDITNL